MTDGDWIRQAAAIVAAMRLPYLAAVFVAFLLLERYFFAEHGHSFKGIFFNVRFTVLYLAVAALLQPALAWITAFVVKWAGGGWIQVPRLESMGLGGAVLQGLAYSFIFDFFYYWFHRLQHSLPVLWSQHKIHHSDTEVNVTTTHRHHLLEEPLRMVFILIPMSLVFRVEPVTGGVLGLVFGLWGFFIHTNLRLDLGPLTPCLGGPQVHRVHHSVLPEHANRNYAALFPVFDLAFGTFVWPAHSEFPATGLHSGERVRSLGGAFLLPFREWGSGRFFEGFRASRRFRSLNWVVMTLVVMVLASGGLLYVFRDSDRVAALQMAPYRVGETITFQQGTPALSYLQSGWSTPEDALVWSDGVAAQLAIPFDGNGPLTATFKLRGFVIPGKVASQRYRIFANGVNVADAVITSADPADIQVRLNADHSSGILHFVIETPDAVSPQTLGINADQRRLGVALYAFRLDRS